MANQEYLNYLEHDDKVRAIDGTFSHNQEWKWFIDLIQDRYELDDVKSWAEFQERNSWLAEIYNIFIRIRGICRLEMNCESTLLNDVIHIADFYIGEETKATCQNHLQSSYGKTLFLLAWIAKLENADNGTDNIYNSAILTTRNYCRYVKPDQLIENTDEILALAGGIVYSDWESLYICLKDNLNQVEFPCSEDFFERYGNQLYKADVFSWQRFQLTGLLTWEEQFLLDMARTSIDGDSLKPVIRNSQGEYPDNNLWTEDRISHMIAFFHNPIADFVLESVRFLKYTKEPDDEVKLAHCSLFTEYMDSHEVWQAFSCSSFKILSLLFRNNLIASIGKKPEFVAFRAKVQSIQDPKMIQRLQDGQMPVTKEQARLVKEYAENLYRQIDGIEGSSNLLDYLCNMQIASHIDDEYLLKVSYKFRSIIADENRALSVLFYDYMLFLFAVNDKNSVTNKRWIRNEMCRTQLLWQDEYYEKQLSQMAVFNYSSSLPTSEVDAINECAVHNPIALAKKVMITNTEELSSEMESMSKNVMGFLITKMDISPVYPKPETIRVHGEDRKVDKIYLEQIKSLLNERGYRYLNQLRPEEYLQGMYQRSMQLIGNMIAFLSAEELYHEVKHLVEPENVYLIDYCESLKLAHITQLFPVLEAKVHNLGKLCGIFPFKQNKEEFMLHKEPSTILKNIIGDIYKETNSLELVPDILFIYDCMYNSNGFSIRNECIHGRKYNRREELPFALKTTCLAILMVNQRIHIILQDLDDYLFGW